MLKNIIEVILYVKNMASEVAFYRDILDLTVSYPSLVTDYSDQPWVTFNTGMCTLALHSGYKGNFDGSKFNIVFEVENIETVREELIQRGVNMGNIREAAPGIKICDGKDPEGNPFSIEIQEK